MSRNPINAKRRVGIVAFLHESNTFLNQPTLLKHFEQNILLSGDDVLNAFRGSNHEVGGFIEAIERTPGFEAVGVFAARAVPYGTIAAECWSVLMQQLQAAVTAQWNLSPEPIDGWLVAPHGATVAENALDADGDWLSRLRSWVGRDARIVGTLDLHANVSSVMIDACDALFAYKTNPHLDQRERGQFAAEILIRTLHGELLPKTQLIPLPMVINIERQATREAQALRLHDAARRWLQRESALIDVSFVYGFPYADVAEMGASVLAVTNNDEALAYRVAMDLAKQWWEDRDSFRNHGVSISNAVEMCVHADSDACIGLLDMGDNVGGGSPGDGTWLAMELAKHQVSPALVWLFDPGSVEQASALGVGQIGHFQLGGKTDPLHGPPLEGEFEVVWIGAGVFEESQPRHGGYSHFDQGQTCILRGTVGNVRGWTVMIASQRVAPVSSAQWTTFGIDPIAYRAIVIKGVHAPVAAYEPICTKLVRVNTPGVTSADETTFDYQRRRIPLYPFEIDIVFGESIDT
jgi:microcystin degradation protein MlrC